MFSEYKYLLFAQFDRLSRSMPLTIFSSHLVVVVGAGARVHHLVLLGGRLRRRRIVHHLLTQVSIVVVWLSLHLEEHFLLGQVLLLARRRGS